MWEIDTRPISPHHVCDTSHVCEKNEDGLIDGRNRWAGGRMNKQFVGENLPSLTAEILCPGFFAFFDKKGSLVDLSQKSVFLLLPLFFLLRICTAKLAQFSP